MSWLLFGSFVVLMCAAVPLAVALGLSGVVVILAAKMGIMSVPNMVYAGIAKYPLIAIPVFILAGMIFERSGVAGRLVRLPRRWSASGQGGSQSPRCWCAWCSAASPAPGRRTPRRWARS